MQEENEDEPKSRSTADKSSRGQKPGETGRPDKERQDRIADKGPVPVLQTSCFAFLRLTPRSLIRCGWWRRRNLYGQANELYRSVTLPV